MGLTSTPSLLTQPNKDHHGFYTVGSCKVYSKLEAIELSVRSGQPVIWNYNQSVFEAMDWSQEPPGSLEFYYRERALQLREKYDYLVLFYSGGSDSHNVLMSFVNNNIFVDEIVQYHQLEAYHGDQTVECNLEQFATSIPITKALIENNPVYKHTVHRLIDFTAYKSDLFKDSKLMDKWWYIHNDFYGVNATAVSNIKYLHPAYRKISDQGRSVCFVWAADKPSMAVDHNNHWSFSFTDSGFSTMISVERKIANESWDHDELFYWSPDFPLLPVKQAHVIKNFVEQFHDQDADEHLIRRGHIQVDQYGQFSNMVNLPSFVFSKHNQTYTMMLDGVRKLLYPWWSAQQVVRPFVRSAIFADSDTAFLNTNTPFEHSRRQYIKGIVHLRNWMKKNAPHYWYEFQYDPKVAPFKGGLMWFKNTYSLERKNS